MTIDEAVEAMFLHGFSVRRESWPDDYSLRHTGCGRFKHTFHLTLTPEDISAEDWERAGRIN